MFNVSHPSVILNVMNGPQWTAVSRKELQRKDTFRTINLERLFCSSYLRDWYKHCPSVTFAFVNTTHFVSPMLLAGATLTR